MVCAAIACRVESKRLYGKPLQMLMDKTLVQHLIFQLKAVKKIDSIVLAIAEGKENWPFVEIAEKERILYVFGSMDNVTERLLKAAESVGADQIARKTPDNPITYIDNLSELIERHIAEKYDFSFTQYLPDGANLELININALHRTLKEGLDKHRQHAVDLYIFENQDKFKIQCVTPPKHLQRSDIRLTIDFPEELMLFRKMYEEIYLPGKLVTVEEAIKFLDTHPEIKKLNSAVDPFLSRAWR